MSLPRRMGVTLGEPFGVGPEIVMKYLDATPDVWASFTVFASAQDVASLYERLFAKKPTWIHDVTFVDVGSLPHQVSDRLGRAKFCLDALDSAVDYALKGRVDAVVTAPLDKSVVREMDPTFSGHTERLAQLAGVSRTVMLLDNGEISVALLTNHLPLRDVPGALSSQSLVEIVTLVKNAFATHFNKASPRLALLGLNPHAGEIVGQSEETYVFAPALRTLKNMGVTVAGPFSADGFLAHPDRSQWDVIFAPYHDQGLVAVKYPGIDRVVNVTLGLPFLRVSPGHGVAYDIAGQGIASVESFKRAMHVAMTRRLRT